MLSIVVCSVNEELLAQLKESIAATIGIEYELLVWDNRRENLGLCEVYNRMAAHARFPFICFCHEDIVFQTPDWGPILLNLFEADEQVALIGIAGGKYKSTFLSGWYTGVGQLDYYNIIHETNSKREVLYRPEKWEATEQQVVCIDGVFMTCRRAIWSEVRFNEPILKGFHFYDIDFSLRIAQAYKVVVTNKINLLHITQGGDYGDKWVNEAFVFHQQMSALLPSSIQPVDIRNIDLIIARNWLNRLMNEPVSWSNKIKWIIAQGLYKHIYLSYAIVKFLLYRPFGLKAIHRLLKAKRQV